MTYSTPVIPNNSSSVESYAYDKDAQKLLVEYKAGGFVQGSRTYVYESVPPTTYDELVVAPSAGKFISANIKGKFKFEKLAEAPQLT